MINQLILKDMVGSGWSSVWSTVMSEIWIRNPPVWRKSDRHSYRIFAFLDLYTGLHLCANCARIYVCGERTYPDILNFQITVIKQSCVAQQMEKRKNLSLKGIQLNEQIKEYFFHKECYIVRV